MGNFRDFLPIVCYTKPAEKFSQKLKIKGSENTFGKFQSIWMLTSAGMRVSVWSVKCWSVK